MENVLTYPLRYSEASIILYFISLEISNLLKEIKNRSPNATKQLPSNINALTPEQIEEAQQDFTGFVKSAISVSAKRQEALNLLESQLARAGELVLQVDGVLAEAIQKPPPISQEEFERLNQARLTLRIHQEDIAAIGKKLKTISTTINDLLAKHAEEWQRHNKNYVDQLISELETQQIILSDLEKKELSEPSKTIEEVKRKLQKEEVIK